jgi:hypothetical protein
MFRTPVLIKDRLIASPLYHQDCYPKPDTGSRVKQVAASHQRSNTADEVTIKILKMRDTGDRVVFIMVFDP